MSPKEKGTPPLGPPPSSSGLPSDTVGRSGDTVEPAATPSTAPILADKFRLIKELGRGGMGAVYEVEHILTKHRRALKVIKQAGSGEHLQRLLREASAAARVGNPHIVETLDAGVLADGQGYIVMELLEGMTLFDFLRSQKRAATMTDLLQLVAQTCDGLHAAHEAGIVHRDIKPGNILVIMRRGAGFVKIVDFGVSKFDPVITEQTEITSDGALLGTPAYMAPEQIRGHLDVDRRADVYALGIILYAASAGERPFQGKTLGDIAIAIATGEHVPLATKRPDLDPSYTNLVEKAMARDRDARFASAKDLADAIRAMLRGSGENQNAANDDAKTKKKSVEVATVHASLTLPVADAVAPPSPSAGINIIIDGGTAILAAPAVPSAASQVEPESLIPSSPPAPSSASSSASSSRNRLWFLLGALAALGIGGTLIVLALHKGPEEQKHPATITSAAPSSSASIAITPATITAEPTSTAVAPPESSVVVKPKPSSPSSPSSSPPPIRTAAAASAAPSGKGPALTRSNPYQ